MPGVLIDTDIAIDYLRGDQAVRPLLHRLWREGSAVLSVISLFELTAGMRENERVATMDFIGACAVAEVTPDIAVRGGELYRHYRGQGVTLAAMDCLIAATAQVKGCQVATRNVRHYPQPGLLLALDGLKQ